MCHPFQKSRWRKDLDLIFKAYYRYNFYSFKESKWSRIRDKVLDHLLSLQEEWRGIKENDPLQYMPYMEEQFFAATGIWLKGLAECTTWIKQGSYYHSVVARKGQLDKCPHLAGLELPKGPQITPSESCLVSQRKPETLVTSSSAPAIEASTPQGATTDVPAPMETGGTGNGHSWVERTRMILKGVGLRNVHGHNQGGEKTGQPFPSHSRMRREDAPPPRRSTGIQDSSHQPVTM